MSHTGRAIYNAMYEPWNLTPAQAALVNRTAEDSKAEACPSDAPTDAEHREHRESRTLSAAEWARYARN
jgi:hypothetical protein